MFFDRLKGVFQTLRFRLMAWNTGVMLLILIPTLVAVREGYRRLAYLEFDRTLGEDIIEVKLSLKQQYPKLDEVFADLKRKAQGHKQHRWFVQLFDEKNKLIWASDSTPKEEDLQDPSAGWSRRQEAGMFRLVQDKLDQAGRPQIFIRVGSSVERVQDDVKILTRILIVVAVLLTFISPLGGYWLSGRATRPLAKIIHTTAGLHPSNLAERLPIRGTGDELDQLSQTINGLLDRIALYLEQKRDFIANAAHELRSPLAAIRSVGEVALNNVRTSDEYVSLVTDIMEECAGLSRLVNQLLLLAEGDAGRLGIATGMVRLDQVVKKSLAMFEGVAESQGVSLRAERLEEIQVPGEENYLRQVVNNLVDNALKFTPTGGRIGVEVAADPSGRQALLRVSDTGAGIPGKDIPRIFERFFQSDKSRHHERGRHGTGLGLSICHSIVTALHGNIVVDSTPGKGSEFTVYLPISTNGHAQDGVRD